ncbi:MAG: bifunctional methylenetetrahydrofolate dehydrogenase/methenyltetrahydrofolate cyclohydrolase FolD [Anaerolineae bacterium]|nr:bifunctional methylenetetrahydrofolate dehydrogenase/methenyltetrahydrofolate cyclohydrolase FolD [Anaerolineae bacterium]
MTAPTTTSNIMDGKAVAAQIRQEVAEGVAQFQAEQGFAPGLAVLLVGENPASVTYVTNKAKSSEEVGIRSEVYRLPADVSEAEVMTLIARLNADPMVHGLFCQLPVPEHLNPIRIQSAIDPAKDVDGLNPISVGRLWMGEEALNPATPLGIIEILKRYNVPLKGKRAVIVGRSTIVGKPVAALLLQEHATVTIAHSRTQPLADVTREADILVVAIGKAEMVTGDMVKPGATVIDVGINRVPDASKKSGFRLVGDVHYASAAAVAGLITPVPGGVGPLTIALLLSNTLTAARRQTR